MDALRGLVRGVEKESLRVTPDGRLATTPHPLALGAALTHPHITTDFSEAQLELITGVHPNADACVQELAEIHQFVYRHLGDEMMWSSSMPCRLPADDEIPLGQYGRSNVGRLKTVYRMGLSLRYGRRMQTISGVHYNFSLPETAIALLQGPGATETARAEFRTTGYFSLIRNFRRHSWLPLYLFGASPAVCSTFVEGRTHRLQSLSGDTLYMPHATSLRMGPLGYQSDAQRSIAVSFNSLPNYAASLHHALTAPYPAYESIGVRGDDGEYRQLATTLLQIENEFYGTIRPKRVIRPGERPLHALRERGVEYVEVRCMDLDPFEHVGIAASTMCFLDVFLMHCLLKHSPPDTPQEIASLARNQQRVAARGREPGLTLERGADDVTLADWGKQLLRECEPIAEALDALDGGRKHRDAMLNAWRVIGEPGIAPSARVLATLARDFDDSFVAFTRAQSQQTQAALLARPYSDQLHNRLTRLSQDSIEEQKRIEASDSLPFETYRQQYLSVERLGLPSSRQAA